MCYRQPMFSSGSSQKRIFNGLEEPPRNLPPSSKNQDYELAPLCNTKTKCLLRADWSVICKGNNFKRPETPRRREKTAPAYRKANMACGRCFVWVMCKEVILFVVWVRTERSVGKIVFVFAKTHTTLSVCLRTKNKRVGKFFLEQCLPLQPKR